MKKIIKRDGRKVNFNANKIENSILLAFEATTEGDGGGITEYAKEKAHNIAMHIQNEAMVRNLTVEEIQDMVEHGLMSCKCKKVATNYIRYRDDRDRVRVKNLPLMKEVAEKLAASNVANQNANVDEKSFGGRMGEVTRTVLSDYALNNCMSELAKNNHLNNEIYIHDRDSYASGMHNCLSIPYDKLLTEGFNTRQTDVRPASSVNTAHQLVAVIAQLQSLQQFGGVSATHLDWTMVPYIRLSLYKHFNELASMFTKWLVLDLDKEVVRETSIEDSIFKGNKFSIKRIIYNQALKLTVKELNQAVEGMYHNLNTLQSRSGNQLPFTSINYGTCTLPEGRMEIKALLEGSLKGVGKHHKTPIFPCGIFQYMKGVNDKPGTPNYDLFRLALKSTAKRLYPNYANVDWSGNAGYDINDPKTYFSTMGCRTANGADINAEEGQNPQLKDGRGNICPVTIILPTIAMEAKEFALAKNSEATEKDIIEIFMWLLKTKISEAKAMLIERYEYICAQSPESAQFMYENGTMFGYKPEEGIRSALKHGTLAIGQLGLAECLQILVKCDHTTSKGMKLAKEIEQMFKDKAAEYKNEYKLNFGVYYTPAENLCYTAMTKFKEKYGVIENISDRDYFTNSMHVPVWHEISPFDKIDIESQLTGYSSAGCITYVELDGGMEYNLDGLEQLVNYAMEKDIPYFAINIPNDTCLDCGYTGEFNDHCPECGSEHIQQLRRVTGYLTGNYKTAFNKGKQAETEDRFRHSQLKEV